MGKAIRKNSTDPIEPVDIFSDSKTITNTFGDVATKEITRTLPGFNPRDYKYVTNPTPYDSRSTLNAVNALGQGVATQAGNSLKQFGANFASGFGQGLANLLDVSAWGNDNYQSSLLGYSTKDMQDWANGVRARNEILERSPGEFNPGDSGWLFNQFAQSGTGLGMGVLALAETAAIESFTGGTGTGVALARLGNLFKNIKNARGATGLVETANAASGLRSAATIYGVMNRTNESRMEAMNSYNEIYETLSKEKNEDGTHKYTEEQLKEYAAAGADRTFYGNMALLPLDIIGYRTMVYNPVSGTGKGIIERGLSNIKNKWLRKGVQGLAFSGTEGLEEGAQFIASEEGKNYAKVLGGIDDGSSFLERVGKDVQKDEFWNNFAGGVIGSPIIGGAMSLANKIMTGNQTSRLNSIHKHFIQNVGKLDDHFATELKKAEEQGNFQKADSIRRQNGQRNALKALHLDALTDKDTGFDSYMNFLSGTLEELNQGKTDSLNDLGITNTTPEQIEKIKLDFNTYIQDAQKMASIYEDVKDKYNRNIVPEVVQDYFRLDTLQSEIGKVDADINLIKPKLNQYNSLSSYGKDQYDAEYELEALKIEKTRLNELSKKSESTEDGVNLYDLIEYNNSKINSISKRLEDISTDDTYSKEQREFDRDIIEASIKDSDYLNAVYKKQRLDNEINLQVKDIKKWKNRDYIQNRNKQIISKAKTKQQVEEVEINLDKPSEETKKDIGDKKREIEINEIADNISKEKEELGNYDLFQDETPPKTDTEVPIGNYDLFSENADTMADQLTGIDTGFNENKETRAAEMSFSPAVIPEDRFDDERKEKLKSAVNIMLQQIGNDPTFEDLVRATIQGKSKEFADKNYNLLVKGWKLNNKPDVDFNQVYNVLFSNPLDVIEDLSNNLFFEGEAKQVSKDNDTVIKDVIEAQGPKQLDNNNQPVPIIYTSPVTNNPQPKFAKLIRLSEQTITETEQGLESNYEFTRDELNEGQYVNSLPLLDPDKYQVGTEMIIKIPTEFNDIKIPIYNEDGTKGKTMTFGQYVAEKGLSPNDQEYKDKIPVIIYDKDAKSGDKGVAFVHDIGWYHERRFNANNAEEMKQAIAATREVREAVQTGETRIVITENRPTTFDPFKTKNKGTKENPNYEFIPLKDANPQAKIVVALNTEQITENGKDPILEDNQNTIIRNVPLIPGFIYDVRRVGMKNGKKAWAIFEISRPPISGEIKTTITQALNIYAHRSVTKEINPQIRAHHDKIADRVREITGLDLRNQTDLQNFLKQYINTIDVDNADTNEKAEFQIQQQSEKRVAQGGQPITGYITTLRGGNIIIGVNGQYARVDEKGVKYKSFFINPNSTKPITTGISHLIKKTIPVPETGQKIDILSSFRQNYHITSAQRNKPVIQIDSTGKVTTVANSYKDFIMSTLKTNIKSHNIGTEENPVYVTSDNMISYALLSKEKTNEEIITEEITSTVTKTASEDSTTTDLLREIQEKAKKILGVNLNNLNKDYLLSPRVLNEDERRKITEQLDRIGGLSEIEEYELIDFFVNEIFNQVPLKDNSIEKRVVIDKVKEIYTEIVTKKLTEIEEEITRLEKLLVDRPNLKDAFVPDILEMYKHEANKIKVVTDNIKTLIKKVDAQVSLNIGAKVTRKPIESNEDNDDIQEGKEGGEQEIDFWTEVLTLNPENKVSHALRRFMRGIPKLDKDGKPLKGVFGLPIYENSTDIIQTLMPMLADVPADFESMMVALKEKASNYTWMPLIVDKLSQADEQTKRRFITVMANSPLRLKFTMISFNRRANSYTTSVWNTNEGGIVDAILNDWRNRFEISELVLSNTDEDGNSKFNKEKAKSLIDIYNKWIGTNLKQIQSDTSLVNVKNIKKDQPAIFTPTGNLLTELNSNLITPDDKMSFQRGTTIYQVRKVDENKFEVKFLQKFTDQKDSVRNWLSEFGINLNDKSFDELMDKGLYHNYQQIPYHQLFDHKTGLFGILATHLNDLVNKQEDHYFELHGKSPIDEGIVKSLARLDSKYDTTHIPHGGRDGGKSFYAITANKFITDRTRELKEKDSKVKTQLERISFSKNSMWLKLLNDEDFKNKFNISHVGFNAMQILGKRNKRDNGITKLSDLDYEITKNGMFWDMKQGAVVYKDKDGTRHNNYPGTDIPMRWGTMLAPTMSDKHIAIMIQTMVLNLQNKHLNSGEGITDQVTELLYSQVVKPELERMINFHNNIKSSNIKSYDNGAGLFLMLPRLNTIQFNNQKLIDIIKLRPEVMTLDYIEKNEELKDKIFKVIQDTIITLRNEKKEVWKKNDMFTYNKDNKLLGVRFIDNEYFNTSGKFTGSIEEKVNMATLDLVVNEMLSLANSFMLYTGDPALFYKKDPSTKSDDYLQIAKDTFTNMGKRLANQIAPGTTLANSKDEKYIQLFIQDRTSIPDKNFIKFSTLIRDGIEMTDEEYDFIKDYISTEKPTDANSDRFNNLTKKYSKSSGFFKIEASDAQEYTTWKEHLDILTNLGKIPDSLSDVTMEEIEEARHMISKGTPRNELSDRQLKILGKVMQPIKPVYTGQIYDEAQDVMRTVYIKSSSFPLIPQLTSGLEIDKLRLKMEEIEKKRNMKVRASYQSANKVGAIKNAALIWDGDGKIFDTGLDYLEQSSLILNRKDFRIQQEIPFKTEKNKEDKITLGTQLMKLLFGDDIINFNNFEYKGNKISGLDLHRHFNEAHIKLIESRQQELYSELGLDKHGIPVDYEKSVKKIQKLLKREAEQRDFPLQTIEGLEIQYERDSTGKVTNAQFVLPLWSSINSNKFEALLNAIVANRLAKIKFPGNSYVVGSEEGFKMQEGLENVNESRIVFTSKWTGELKATYHDNGKIKIAQVLAASKFRDNNGNIIDLLKDDKYVTKNTNGTYTLKEDMFDENLLKLTSFRIPTTGISSGSQIEIVGFLPFENADLMIVPKNFTKQKGLDFDIDKENTYQYWHYMNEDGKFEKFQSKHKASILSKIDENLKDDPEARKFNKVINEFAKQFQIEDYTEEEINEQEALRRLNVILEERLVQNDIVEIYQSVFSNPDKKLQAKINSVLNTDFTESEAAFIDSLNTSTKEDWTALSGEYQKQKLQLGANGKIGTGAYALDITFHSLAQQIAAQGRTIGLTEVVGQGEEARVQSKKWKFGKLETSGLLGQSETLDGSRTISDLLNEIGQIAVDNEKLQIMGRVNLNSATLDVHKIFNLLGVDKGEDGHSIPFLFLSQPIIKDYVLRLSNAKSNLLGFEKDRVKKVINGLLREYDKDFETRELDDVYYDQRASEMDNKTMIAAIKSPDPKNEFGVMQAGILLRFLEMEQYGLAIRNIQTTLNVDSKGLDKSFFNVIQKRNKLDSLGNGNPLLTNLTALVGDYQIKPSSRTEIDQLLEQGYHITGNYMIKPQSLSGAFNVNTVTAAYNLWSNYLPYDSKVINELYNEILPIIENPDSGNDVRQVENKQDIFAEIKKYISTHKNTGIINEEDNINEERRSLYIDTEENTSLAKYMYELTKMTGDSIIEKFIKTNKLINKFTYDIKKNGTPSLIKFNNTKGESFDESHLYNGLTTLFEVRGKEGKLQLPKIGNKQYTLDTLAQALIEYSFIGNAKQEAIQFTKYIPVSYLTNKYRERNEDGSFRAFGYALAMRRIHDMFERDNSIFNIKEKDDKTRHLVSPFTTQYIQHNPEMVKYKLDVKEFKEHFKDIGNGKFLIKSEGKPTFVSVYDPSVKDKKKFRLYKFDGESYSQIPILGVFGMDEYQFGVENAQSIVNGKVRIKQAPQSILNNTNTESASVFNIENGTPYEIFENISKSNSKYAPLVQRLLPFVNNVKIELMDTVDSNTNFEGIYLHKLSKIIINPKIISNSEELARVLTHELVHHLTRNQVDAYVKTNSNGSVEVRSDAPGYVSDLVLLYNSLRRDVDPSKLQYVRQQVKKDQPITPEERTEYYSFFDIHEFMTAALTDVDFQKKLSTIPYKQSGKSFLDKFKEFISQIFISLGVKFDENYTLAHAVSTIFNVIEQSNQGETINPYETMYEEVINMEDIDQGFNPDNFMGDTGYFDENNNTPPETSLSINTLPKRCN